MKKYYFLILSIAFSSALFAQQKPTFFKGTIKSFQLPPVYIQPDNPLPFLNSQPRSPLTINPNPKIDKIIILPLDNMPCVASTITANMPVVSGLDFSHYKPVPIPNGLREPIIRKLSTD